MWIKESWEAVISSTIVNCFKKAGFNLDNVNYSDECDDNVDEELNVVGACSIVSDEFICCDDNLMLCETFDEEIIIDVIEREIREKNEDEEDVNVADDDEIENVPINTPTASESHEMLSKLKGFVIKSCTELIPVSYKDEKIIDDFISTISDKISKQILQNSSNQTIQSSNTIALSISNVENACSLCLKIFRRLFYYLKRNLGQNQIIQFTDGNGNSFLHISAVLLLPELCHHFIKSGANINQLNSNRNSPLQELLYYHKPNILLTHGDQFYDTVKILASNKTDISNVNLNGMNCFQYSLQYKDEKLIENLIAHSTNVNIEEDDFNFFFNNKWISLLRKLIFMIPEQFITDEILLQSAKIYPFDIFILIWRFCSDEIRMRSVEKLLYQTSNNNKEKIFKFCCEFKINSSRLLDNGETILTALIKEDKSDFCYHILKSTFGKFVIDRPNRDGWTPLHCAAFKYNLNLFEEILNHCSHLYIENNEGETALAILLRKIPQNSDIKHVTHLIKFMIYRNIDIYSLSSTNQRVIDNCQNENLKKEIERIYALKPSNNNL